MQMIPRSLEIINDVGKIPNMYTQNHYMNLIWKNKGKFSLRLWSNKHNLNKNQGHTSTNIENDGEIKMDK